MNEQNRQRLERIAARRASRIAQGWSEAESDAAFLAGFERVRDDVLLPVMDEVGAQLSTTGYGFRIANGGTEASPAIDFHILIPGRGDSKDTIRFFAAKDAVRGWQVIAEIDLKRTPMELARFGAGEQITREVVEQLVVDAVEQMFASTVELPMESKPLPVAPASASTAAPPPATNAMPSESPEAAVSVRALVTERLSVGRRLHGLDLVDADLHGLDFTGARMSALDLRRVNLRGCLLAGARLTGARLGGADLTDAVLTGANLSRADLSGAVLVGARFDGALLVDTTGMPPKSPEHVVAREPEQVDKVHEQPCDPVPAPDQAPEPALPPLVDAPEMRWARWAGAQDVVGETGTVDVAALRRAMLPFVKGAPAPQFFAAADAARAERRGRPAASTGHETVALPVLALPAGAESAPPMSLEQYAAFCAELAVFPAHAVSIHLRYGLASADARKALDEVFARRFGVDPSQQRRWQALVVHYGDWYRRQPAPLSATALRVVACADATSEAPRAVALVSLGAPARQRDETVPLTRSMLSAARARGPLPFLPPTPPVIRERPTPADDDEDQTVELQPHPGAAPALPVVGPAGGPKK